MDFCTNLLSRIFLPVFVWGWSHRIEAKGAESEGENQRGPSQRGRGGGVGGVEGAESEG